jgi:hypothetical protein
LPLCCREADIFYLVPSRVPAFRDNVTQSLKEEVVLKAKIEFLIDEVPASKEEGGGGGKKERQKRIYRSP